MKPLILGMGSPILSDDGIGLYVADCLQDRFHGVDVVTTAMAGLNVLDILEGYDKVFLIDAVTSRNGNIGDLKKLTSEEGTLHLFSSHGINFFELLQLGKEMGLHLPEIGAVYGIEIGDRVEFSEHLTSTMKGKVSDIIKRISEDIALHLN